MNPELADWLNRISLILGFLSFWLVAPEFIGERRLKSWETALASGLLKMPLILRIVSALCVLIGAALYGIEWVSSAVFSHPLNLAIPAWFAVPFYISIFLNITEPLTPWAVKKLANDSNVRQRSFFVGAILFTISCVMQFAATFQSARGR
jgi:hypothetical protein